MSLSCLCPLKSYPGVWMRTDLCHPHLHPLHLQLLGLLGDPTPPGVAEGLDWDNMDDSGQTHTLLGGAPSSCLASEPQGLWKEDGASAALLGALQHVGPPLGNVEKCLEQGGTHSRFTHLLQYRAELSAPH